MKKGPKVLLIGFGILILILGALTSLVIWALNTAEGTRALLKTVSVFSPLQIDAREISGGMRDDLKMHGLRIRWPQGEMRVESFHLQWEAGELWNRKVFINELSLEGVQLQDNRPEAGKISFPGWPAAPFWLTKLQGRVDSLKVNDLVYRRRNQDPWPADKLFARLLWEGEVLRVNDFSLGSPLGQAEGMMKMVFPQPALNLNLKVALAEEYAGLDSLLVKLNLEPVENQEASAGAVVVSGQRKGVERLILKGSLGLTRTVLGFNNLLFLQPWRKGILQGEGEVTFAEKPILQLKANFTEWDLAPELGLATDLSGKLEMKGSLEDYRGQVFIANRIKGWTGAQVSAAFRGNLDHLEITNLDASWLKGSLQGPLKISWVKGISLQGKIQGRKLNPALFSPEWQGEFNLNLEGKFYWPKTGTPEASFKVNLLESRLGDRVFTGDLAGGLKENLLQIARLQLRGPGFDLKAKGVLQEKVKVDARITDLSRLIPETRGDLSATGWVRFVDNRLNGVVTAQGKDLMIQTVRVGTFNTQLELREYTRNAPPIFSLEARAGNLQVGTWQVERANLNLAGTPATHQASLALRFNGGEIQGELKGAYKSGSWKGSIEKLGGRDRHGIWNLQKPARVTLSSKQFLLTPLVLKSTQGETLQANADLSLNPMLGSIKAQWETIALARANPWLPRGNLSGQASGSFTAEWRKSGMRVSGKNNLKGAFNHDRMKIEVPSGQVKLEWNEKGLLAGAVLKINKEGIFDGQISSTEPFHPALPKEGNFDAQWKAIDLGLFNPLLPKSLLIKGQNSGSLSGRWSPGLRLDAVGKMKVSQGQVAWSGGHKPISMNLDAAEMDLGWRGESIQGNVSLSSGDYGWLKGTFLLPLSPRLPPSLHPDGPLKISLQGQLREKGLLANLYPEWIQKSRGKMGLNLSAEGTWGKPRLKGTLQISDAGFQVPNRGGPPKNGETSPALILEISSGSAAVDWGAQGLWATLNIALSEKGRIEGKLSSPEPAHFAFPQEGKMDLAWKGLDLASLQPYLPGRFPLEGEAAGQINGQWLPGSRLDVAGGVRVARGKLSWQGNKGLVTAGLHQADLDFLWREERIQGNVSLSLVDYGSLKGSFRLPLPARLPLRFDSKGPLQVLLRGQAQEKGLITALLPGMVKETRGNMEFELVAEGTREKPIFQGTLQLTNAGAYLPALGIRIEDLSTRWKLQNEQIQIESFQARSGPGRIEGKGAIWLKNWELQRYEGSLTGEKFQTLFSPELQIQSSPRLNFQGTPHLLSVRGEIFLPEAKIYETSAPGMVRPSSDVVIIDQPPERKSPLSLDIQVKIVLGDKIQVKAAGIDTRLAGSLELKIQGMKAKDMTARGEVRTVGGLFSGYGLSMRIDHGRFIYSSGPVDNPGLDVLALRKSDDLEKLYNIKVGVTVLGTLKNPNIKLYSQPAMKDEDILSYLVLGRPYDPKQGNLSLLLTGAGGLLAGGSPGVLDKVKGGLAIDTVDIQAGTEQAGAPQTAIGEVQRSLVTIGKYLTPQLYISYGYSVFTNEQLLKARYQISKRWEVETWRGNALGVDLYYRIEFY